MIRELQKNEMEISHFANITVYFTRVGIGNNGGSPRREEPKDGFLRMSPADCIPFGGSRPCIRLTPAS